MSDDKKIKIMENGPYMVFGDIPLTEEEIKKDSMGRADKWVEKKKHNPDGVYALCRCGKSTDKPFCSGSHDGFDGTETARRGNYADNAAAYPGAEGVVLYQDTSLCVGTGFCHNKNSVTQAIKKERTLDIAKQQICDCPGGSLVLTIDGVEQEPVLEKSISATSTPSRTGALWVKGGIPVISSDGYQYEVRNRTTLCCCGRSAKKPFCDASHLIRNP